MEAGPIVAAVGVLTSTITWFLGQRRGAVTERRNAERDHENRRPRIEMTALTKGSPRVQLVHQGGPVLDEVELEVLDPLPDTIGAGLLRETSWGVGVRSLTLPGRMSPGDVRAVGMALDSERRGSQLRLRLICRVLPPKRRWSFRSSESVEWIETTSVTYPQPPRVSTAVGLRLPSEAELGARRRR